MAEEDGALIERWGNGDARAGEQLFARHFEAIRAFFAHTIPEAADDLTQRTFLACAGARGQFRGDASFRTYLFTIARHELHAWLAKLRRGTYLDFDEISIAAILTSPTSRIARRQEADRLLAALRELPVEQQTLLVLHYWHELDAAQLARVFETSTANVYVRLTRARKALQHEMDRGRRPEVP